MQKILKQRDKIVVLVDFRERDSSITDTIEKMGVMVKTLPLKVGDYIVSDRTVIEHKTSDDFVNSIIDGRLFRQVEELKENFEKPIMIIEGSYFRESMNENAVKSAIASIILDHGIPIIMTRDGEETGRMIFWLAKREQFGYKRTVAIKGRKKPKRLRDLQESIVSSFPGISTVLSKRILEEFGSIREFANTNEARLKRVKGIGKVLAKKICKILTEKY